MNILITICARGGSKGIPKKNIKEINNFPLIYYTLKTANLFRESVNKVNTIDIVLSTDSEEIKKVVENQNLYIETDYTRSDVLASDTAGKLDAIKDVKLFMELKHRLRYDYVLDLDVTAPLRTVEDLKEALELLENNKEAYNIFSVSPASRNPYFNMVEKNEEGFFQLCKNGKFLSRQVAPKVYDMNASFYFYKHSFFENKYKTAITDKSLIYEMKHICFDLDHPIDFDFMEYLLENNKLDFEFL